MMYSKLPNLVLGFHGCDQSTFNSVIKESQPMKASNNKYDWLGPGIYFWENNYERAYDWAVAQSSNPKSSIKEPAVIGAVIDLGYCLNLTDYESIEIIKRGYKMLKLLFEELDEPMPENKNIKNNTDLLVRNLDCAVIQQIHTFNKETDKPAYDSVRGVFVEGSEIYPNSGFRDKTHIQLCIVNPNCIKGFFDPRKVNKSYPIP